MAAPLAEDRQADQLTGRVAGSACSSVPKEPIVQKDDAISDEMETIRAVKAGDTDAYALVVERYHRPLLSFIVKMVGDRDMVEDLGQDVFLAVYRSLPMFDETKGVPFSAWIFTVARNRCLTVLRQRRTRKQEEPIAADLPDSNRKTPEEMVLSGGLFHGFQLWVNLPAKEKWAPPRYQDIRANTVALLRSADGGALIRVIAGELGGQKGPGVTFTPITYAHVTLLPVSRADLPWRPDFHAPVYPPVGFATPAGPATPPMP